MEQKPAGIIYGVNDIPPLRTTLLLAFQHAALALVFIVYPLMVLSEASATQAQAEAIVTASILAIAAGTFLQCLGRQGMGSGYLVVHISTPAFLPVAFQAVAMGGMGLLFGMTVVAGIFMIIFSRFLRHLRKVFPAEVCGVAILALGISMVGAAMSRMLGLGSDGQVDPNAVVVAAVTLTIIVALSVWPKGRIRLYSVMIGIACGYGTALYFGVVDAASIRNMFDGGFLALPTLTVPEWKFEWILLIPFLLVALVSSLDSVAGIVTCQKINQSEWVRPDMNNAGRGILADGVGVTLSGMLGTLGTGISTSHIALSSATGATARRIGLLAAVMLLVLAFVPPIAKLLSQIPAPVMGVVLFYASVFLITSGIGLITTRMMDNRRVFMVGSSIVAGLFVLQFPELAAQLPIWLSSVVGSAFAVSSLCAIILNLLFLIGTSQTATIRIKPELVNLQEVRIFFEQSGGSWGARRQVIQRAEAAVNELLETLILMELTSEPIVVQARFDEYNLDVKVSYAGMEFSALDQQPVTEQLLDEDAVLMRLPAMLIRQYADRVAVDRVNQQQRVLLHFEH